MTIIQKTIIFLPFWALVYFTSIFFFCKRTICGVSFMTAHDGEMGTLKLTDLTRSSRMEIRQNLHMQPKQPSWHQQRALSVCPSFSSSTLPGPSKHRGKFTNLRDSVKKSPTKSTAKVKAASGWVSDGSCSNCSLEKVCIAQVFIDAYF